MQFNNIQKELSQVQCQLTHLAETVEKRGSATPQEKAGLVKIAQHIFERMNSVENSNIPKHTYVEINKACENLLTQANRTANLFGKTLVIGKTAGSITLVETYKAPCLQSKDIKTTEGITNKLFGDKINQKLFPSYGENVLANKKMEKLNTLEEQHKQLSQTTSGLNPKQLKEVHAKLQSIEERTTAIKADLMQFNHFVGKRKEVGVQFETLGGSHVHIETSDKAEVHGCFLSSAAFREKMIKDGGKQITLTREYPNGEICQVQGICFQKANLVNNKTHFVNTLNSMNVLSKSYYKEGMGWSQIENKTEIILVPDSYLNDNPMIDKSYQIVQESGMITTRKEKDIPPPSKESTVILSSGNAGVYEMHKQEICSFLFKGMNVMAFNFRGYGESKGKASMTGFERDAEAAYQYVKEKTKQEDRSILLLPLCMSTGPEVSVAARHPEVNVFINQGYSDFHQLVSDSVDLLAQVKINQLEDEQCLKGRLTKQATKTLLPAIRALAELATPQMNVADNLAQNQGEKAIFFAREDKVISTKHVEKNIEAITKSGELKRLTVISSPGEHSMSWVNTQSSPKELSGAAKESHAQLVVDIRQTKRAIRALRKKIIETESKKEEAKPVLDHLMGEQNQLIKHLGQIESTSQTRTHTMATFHAQLNDYQESNKKITTELKSATSSEHISKLTNELTNNKSEMSLIEKKLESMEKSNMQLNTTKFKVETALGDVDKSVSEVRGNIDLLSSEAEHQTVQMQGLNKKLLILQKGEKQMTTKAPIIRHQMSQFLIKAQLSNELIEENFHVKTTSTKNVKEAQKVFNELDNVVAELGEFTEVSEVKINASGYQLTGSVKGEEKKLQLSNQDVSLLQKVHTDGEKLVNFIQLGSKGIKGSTSSISAAQTSISTVRRTLPLIEEAYAREFAQPIEQWSNEKTGLNQKLMDLNVMADFKELFSLKDLGAFAEKKAAIQEKYKQLDR